MGERTNERVKQTRESKRRSPLILMHKMIVMLFASMIEFIPKRYSSVYVDFSELLKNDGLINSI